MNHFLDFETDKTSTYEVELVFDDLLSKAFHYRKRKRRCDCRFHGRFPVPSKETLKSYGDREIT